MFQCLLGYLCIFSKHYALKLFQYLHYWIVGHHRPRHVLLPVAEAGCINNDRAREASRPGRGQSIIPGGILVCLVELGDADGGGD